jgi:hypothetical protein
MKESKTKLTPVASRDDICFPVEVIKNPEWTNSEYSRIVVGQINGKQKMLNYCSPVYKLIPNMEVFPVIEELFNKAKIPFKASYSHINHVHFYANYIIEKPEFAHHFLGTNDIIKFKWHQQMSYNGKTKLMGWGGFYRQVCTNGLMIPCAELKQFNLRVGGKHTESVKVHIATINAMLTSLSENYATVSKTIIDKYELLGGRMVTDADERIKEVLEASNIIAVENSKFNTVDNILGRITAELEKPELAGYNGVINDWLIYNGINQYINDNERNSTLPEKRAEIDSKVLEYMLENA